MSLDFTEIGDGEAFEVFCSELLRSMGFEIVLAPGRGPDSGVDLVVRTPQDSRLGISNLILVQCKHYATSRRAVGLDDLSGPAISDLLAAHRAHGYLLITSTIPSQATQDHLRALRESTGRAITAWSSRDLESKIVECGNPSLIHSYFPRSGRHLRDAIILPHSLAGWDTIRTTLYARALTDISDHIGRKYIPDLYVTRSETEKSIDTFIASATSDGELVVGLRELSDRVRDSGQAIRQLASMLPKSKVLSEEYPLPGDFPALPRSATEAARRPLEHLFSNLLLLEVEVKNVEAAAFELAPLADPSKTARAAPRSYLNSLLSLIRTGVESMTKQCAPLRKALGTFQEGSTEWKETIDGLRQQTRTADIQRMFKFAGTLTDSANECILRYDKAIKSLRELDACCSEISTALRPCLAIIERAGRGKTNLVCDLVRRCGKHYPVLFLAAKSLPLSSEYAIEDYLSERLKPLTGFEPRTDLDYLAAVAHLHDASAVVIIDGINESVDPFAFAMKLHSFLARVSYLPLRVIITCREEYWRAFSNAEELMAMELHGQMGYFTEQERNQAVRKYFAHYKISSTLDAEPSSALRDPLLLRFFCEAYGDRQDVVGERVTHIRLRALFDEYRRVKYADIVKRYSHIRYSDAVSDYVDRIAKLALTHCTGTIERKHLLEVLPPDDLVNVQSLYAHLLDEDIVIEQRFVAKLNDIVLTFTYEAFMEYILGSIVARHLAESRTLPLLFATQWLETNKAFPNGAGVLGFFLTFVFEQSRTSFAEIANWMSTSGDEKHLYSLQIALDNVAPEELDIVCCEILLKQLAIESDGMRKATAFPAVDVVRILRRTPVSLAPVFSSALHSKTYDFRQHPFEWADILEHFGREDPRLMWQSIDLRFFATDQLFQRLSAGRLIRMLEWLREDVARLEDQGARKVVPKLLTLWKRSKRELEAGSWGGLSNRGTALARLFSFLEEHVAL